MRSFSPTTGIHLGLLCTALFVTALTSRQAISQAKPQPTADDSEAKPPVSDVDLQIVDRAAHMLGSPLTWNRADTRICPDNAVTFSLYCALEKATKETSGEFKHRGAAMQEARFVIDQLAPNRNYEHRLMGYNNDPSTTFADIQTFFRLLHQRIASELNNPAAAGSNK